MIAALVVYSTFTTLLCACFLLAFSSCKAVETKLLRAMRDQQRKYEDQREELRIALARMVGVFDALMPGAKYIAIQDYGELNAAPIAARKLLQYDYSEDEP